MFDHARQEDTVEENHQGAQELKMSIPQAIREVLLDLVNDRSAYPVVFVLRGLPGTGKTWLAENILRACNVLGISGRMCSADSWFMRGGHYQWQRRQLTQAHEHCMGMCLYLMHARHQVVVVDNTNLRDEDYQWYVDAANGVFYEPFIVEFHVESAEEAALCTRRSHVANAANYNAWQRWDAFTPNPDALVLRPSGLDDEDPQETRENHERGYM